MLDGMDKKPSFSRRLHVEDWRDEVETLVL